MVVHGVIVRFRLVVVIPEELIQKLLAAITQAPSARNQQPWQFVVIDDRAIPDQDRRIHAYRRLGRPGAATTPGSQHVVQSPSSSNFLPPQFGQLGWPQTAALSTSRQRITLFASHGMRSPSLSSVSPMPDKYNCWGNDFRLGILTAGRGRKGGTAGRQRSFAEQFRSRVVWVISSSPNAPCSQSPQMLTASSM